MQLFYAAGHGLYPSFEDDQVVDVIEELSKKIVLYGIRYELAGYSIASITAAAVITWRGEFYFYMMV